MISNRMIVDGMRKALEVAFTIWLNENKSTVLQIVSASMNERANIDNADGDGGRLEFAVA